MLLAYFVEKLDYAFDVRHTALMMIDMQRDFIEDGGFGGALGNDVSLLRAIVPAAGELLSLCRNHDNRAIHTKEARRPDLSDCPISKLRCGNVGPRIADRGPMGRILMRIERQRLRMPADR